MCGNAFGSFNKHSARACCTQPPSICRAKQEAIGSHTVKLPTWQMTRLVCRLTGVFAELGCGPWEGQVLRTETKRGSPSPVPLLCSVIAVAGPTKA